MLKCHYFSYVMILFCCWNSPNYALDSPSPDRARGAILFMNYCNGCHSLRYLSWTQMETDLQVSPEKSLRMKQNLRLSIPNAVSTWPDIAMASGDAQHWFGKPPPDLSLVARQRGANWIQTYLLNFYPDHSQRFGMNNRVLPNSSMPNILQTLQQDLSPQEFKMAIADIADFLDYASDPSVVMRRKLGGWVIGFLTIFSFLFWLRMTQIF